jgi:hypothetical protein
MGTFLIWTIGVLLGSTFTIYTSFFALCTAKRLKLANVPMPPDMRMAARILFVIGVPADIVFNLYRGYLIFGEFRRVTFSQRIEWYMLHPQRCPDFEKALYWARILHAADEGHVKGYPRG